MTSQRACFLTSFPYVLLIFVFLTFLKQKQLEKKHRHISFVLVQFVGFINICFGLVFLALPPAELCQKHFVLSTHLSIIPPSAHPPLHHECFLFDLSATGWGNTFNLHFRASARQKAPGHGLGLFIAAVFSGCGHFCGLGSRSICCSRKADRDPSGQMCRRYLVFFIGFFIVPLTVFFFPVCM